LSRSKKYDVCVVGGGSGGVGAAVSAARHGARTLLIEASPDLGGTSTRAGVNNYEPVAGATGLPQELFDRLKAKPSAVSIQKRTAKYHPDRRWGIYERTDETDYRLSLSRRSGTAIVFEPEAMSEVMRTAVRESGCDLLLNTRFTEVSRSGSTIDAISINSVNGPETVVADVFIDSTADINLARAAGCESSIGVEPASLYNEPTAPDTHQSVLNAASLCYRIRRLASDKPAEIEPPPAGIDLEALNPVTSIRTYPVINRNMNPLRLMT
jgi:flavin-dependent dehydrogenase